LSMIFKVGAENNLEIIEKMLVLHLFY